MNCLNKFILSMVSIELHHTPIFVFGRSFRNHCGLQLHTRTLTGLACMFPARALAVRIWKRLLVQKLYLTFLFFCFRFHHVQSYQNEHNWTCDWRN